jgi:MFS family permease
MTTMGPPGEIVTAPEAHWDPRYEWKAVLLLGLAFGLVGVDRFVLMPLFPAIAADLKLNYSDLGQLVGILAVTWGVFAIIMGRISDRIGRRKVIIPSLLMFSLMSAFTGLAGGMLTLLLIRGLMGAAEGAHLPASVAATGEASHVKRRGLNQGLQIGASTLLGWGIAPIVATQLLTVLPSWRQVFMIVALPGFIVAVFLYKVLREPPHLRKNARSARAESAPKVPWGEVLRYRNVTIATLAIFGAMCCVFVMGAMVPTYLVDHLHLSPITMGFVTSGLGWGGFVGEFVLAGLSDYIGRRNTVLLSFLGALIFVFMFSRAPANPAVLFGLLLGVAFFGLGLLALLTGPVATEAVPPALTSSAIGVVSGAGEIFGGGIAPIITGIIAQRSGIQNMFWVPLIGLALGLIASVAMKETAPRRVAALSAKVSTAKRLG